MKKYPFMRETRCANCIYGGVQIDHNGEIVRRFAKAEKVVGAIWKTINYKNGDYGCRNSFFESKEEVCLGNAFSEYREPSDVRQPSS